MHRCIPHLLSALICALATDAVAQAEDAPGPQPSGDPPEEVVELEVEDEQGPAAEADDSDPAPPRGAATAADGARRSTQEVVRPVTHDRPREVEGLGLSPTLPQYGENVGSTGAPPPMLSPPSEGEWRFDFHGYMRAPMRVGLGPSADGSDDSELHSPPRVPDLSFTDWRYTNNIPGPWVEMLFSYGNSFATMTVGVAAYNQTVAGYRELQAQLGINQAFVTLRFPNAFGRHGGLVANVGSFTNRYGTAGKYDAGAYQTYLFGRTRVAGETLTANLHLTPKLELVLEHGIGAKLDVIPFEATNPRPEYLPYPGPVPQGSTFVHHAHAGVVLSNTVTVGAHYLTEWTPDDRHVSTVEPEPGRLSVYGGEVRLNGGVAGDGYIGYSHVDAENVLPLADGIELLHSMQGFSFKNNYFGRFDPRTGIRPPDDSGTVDTVLFEYAFSFGKLARYPTRFWGKGPDLVLMAFGMFNHVESETFSHDKLKWGADLLYTPLEFLGIGGRYDLVQPDLEDREDSFAVLSPRMVLRTAFITHERVVFQYSRYFYGSEVTAAFPYNEQPEPDPNVFMISGSMWW